MNEVKVVSNLFGKETVFCCSNGWEERRAKTLIGEQEFLERIIGLCNEGTVFYDVGAAVGSFGLHVAHFAKDVIMIEADTSHCFSLLYNLGANESKNVRMYQFAVGAEMGKAKLWTDKKTDGHCPSLIRNGHGQFEEVEMVTLDWLFKRFGMGDVVKIDIEGGEFDAVRVMKTTPRYMCIELHHKYHGRTREQAFAEMDGILKNRYKVIYRQKRGGEDLVIWEAK